MATIPETGAAVSQGAIVITGGAGLVGQNLVTRLKAKGYSRRIVIDKAAENAAILRRFTTARRT